MARSKGTWTRTLYKHGFVWWLLVGWWWRPIAWFSSTLFAKTKHTRITFRLHFYAIRNCTSVAA